MPCVASLRLLLVRVLLHSCLPLGALVVAAMVALPVSAATVHVPGDQPTIAAGLGAAAPGDVVLVAPGTYVVGSTLSASTSGVTLRGSGVGSTIVQVASSVGYLITITGANFTLENFTIEKTDLPSQNMILVLGNGCTIRDNEIYGPDPGMSWSASGIVSRALEVGGGLTGLLVQNNVIHHLRQPGYINASSGSVIGNTVSVTRGWVVDGATLAFAGNTWGANQGADIALLASVNPLDYPDLLAVSNGNANAFISGQFAGAASGRAHAYVDVAAPPAGPSLQGSATLPYSVVQSGVNGALPGGYVWVAAGAYSEQVSVAGKSLTVRGAGPGVTRIEAPGALAATFTTSGPNRPVFTATGASDVRLRDLTIDGMGAGNANNRLVGIGFWNAGGAVDNVDIVGVRNAPLDGTQAGNGILAANNTGGPYAIALDGVDVSDFQKNGLTLTGAGLTATITGGSVTGAGNTTLIAQNGIQVSGGASATVNGCAISNLRYTPASVVSVGLLVFGPGSVDASNLTAANKFSGVQVPVYYIDASGSVDGVEIDASSSEEIGIIAYNTTTSAVVSGLQRAPAAPAVSPAEEAGSPAMRAGKNGRLDSSTVLGISYACLSGSGTPGTVGVGAFSAGGPLNVEILNSTITNWDRGIFLDGIAVNLEAHDNSISGNSSAGLDNVNSGGNQDAERNWWGSSTGPSGAGPGTGDAVLGSNVDFDPWRISGADNLPGCGFQPDADNEITPGPAPSCISLGNPCVTIPVVINRTDSANLRGYSVDLQLSANLVLCSTPSASITVGPYLATGAGTNGTNFQVVSNGGGSYTVDEAILGLPCGATGSGGTIFNLQVKAAGGGDGTGTITVTAVTLRDCDNAPIAGTPGLPLDVTIDQTAPSAIAALAAAQVKAGNDGDGTTKINLTWPAVEAGATVEVYRRGFGNYPEYDDPPTPGAGPAAPSYPPPAPWTLSAVSASGGNDEVASPSRDFWYYVAFVKDGCGNVSAVSNRTNGTLNYHLGDVSNGFVAGQGDNLVSTADISLLGANYGLIGVAVNPVNYLDVGPTTDFSVDKRPTTDNRINFEDLIMFAINYGTVAAPGTIAERSFTGVDALALSTEGAVGLGGTVTARLRLAGSGRIQGLSTRLSWNPNVVAPASYEAGDLVTGAGGVLWSPQAGTLDAALLGVREAGFEGDGELATLSFRVIGEGDPAIAIAEVVARDARNQPVQLGDPIAVDGALPQATRLLPASPNPAVGATMLSFSLAKAGRVELAIYSVDGRRVKSILAETREAGFHGVAWDGSDDGGRRLGAGVYFARMVTADGERQSRAVTLLGR